MDLNAWVKYVSPEYRSVAASVVIAIGAMLALNKVNKSLAPLWTKIFGSRDKKLEHEKSLMEMLLSDRAVGIQNEDAIRKSYREEMADMQSRYTAQIDALKVNIAELKAEVEKVLKINEDLRKDKLRLENNNESLRDQIEEMKKRKGAL